MLKKLWKKIRMWFMLQYINAGNDVIEAVKKGTGKMKEEETLACEHETLIQLIPKDAWYQCKKCKMVYFLEGCSGWNLNTFQHLTKVMNEKVNKEDKCKKKTKK